MNLIARVLIGRYVLSRFCNRVVFGKIIFKIDYELIFYYVTFDYFYGISV